jgi:CO/xanthine dehydrogenase Mo-binding subunit
VEGSVDIGGSRTSISMQLAETLGIPAADVKPLVADTDAVGYTEGTYGSRTTFATGLPSTLSWVKSSNSTMERAAQHWEVEPAQVKARTACLRPTGNR